MSGALVTRVVSTYGSWYVMYGVHLRPKVMGLKSPAVFGLGLVLACFSFPRWFSLNFSVVLSAHDTN